MFNTALSFINHPLPTLVNNPISNLCSRNIYVPEDLSALTTFDPESEVDPRDVNMTQEGVDIIWQRLEDLYRSGITPGIGFCLRKKGQVVLDRTIGHAKGNGPGEKGVSKKLLTTETPICQYSASKAVTAMLIHLLAERGEINLLDPVCHYIPEFSTNGKHDTSLYHVLTHQSGFPKLPSHLESENIFKKGVLLNALCEAEADTKAGNTQAYHAITGGVILGEIIERVSGMDIRDFLRKNITEPLNMTHFNYGATANEFDEIATNYSTGLPVIFPMNILVDRALGMDWDGVVDISNTPAFYKEAVPAGNLIATANDMSRFYQLLLNGGELDGVRIFHPDTVHRSVMNPTDAQLDATMLVPMRYSAGHMLGDSPIGLWGPDTENAFGHVGFINTFCWADPDRNISVSLQTTGKCLLSSHLLIITVLLTAIAKHTQDEENHV